MKNIGPELNRIMTERRIVRKDIAKEVGITPTYLSAIVRKNSIDCELLDKTLIPQHYYKIFFLST